MSYLKDEKETSNKANLDYIDQGFTAVQMQELENVEDVSIEVFIILSCVNFGALDGKPKRCRNYANC